MLKNKNIIIASRNALDGFFVLLKERSVRREILILVYATVLLILNNNFYSFTLLILCFVLISVESLNTAIEVLCDHLTLEIHPEIKIIKDLGAAAVFVLLLPILFLSVWCSMLLIK